MEKYKSFVYKGAFSVVTISLITINCDQTTYISKKCVLSKLVQACTSAEGGTNR